MMFRSCYTAFDVLSTQSHCCLVAVLGQIFLTLASNYSRPRRPLTTRSLSTALMLNNVLIPHSPLITLCQGRSWLSPPNEQLQRTVDHPHPPGDAPAKTYHDPPTPAAQKLHSRTPAARRTPAAPPSTAAPPAEPSWAVAPSRAAALARRSPWRIGHQTAAPYNSKCSR